MKTLRLCAPPAALVLVLLLSIFTAFSLLMPGRTARTTAIAQSNSARVTVHASGMPVPVKEAVLFAFDDHSMPWRRNLYLTYDRPKKHPDNPVVRRGPKSAPDWHRTTIGTVLYVDGRFRMWYRCARDPLEKGNEHRLCYAESGDGIRWIKPSLSLVEFAGNKENNLLLVEPEGAAHASVYMSPSVIYDPDDSDPTRRYKMIYHSRRLQMHVAVSADGLRWRCLSDGPAIPDEWEVSSFYRFGDTYYATGQDIGFNRATWLADGSPSGRVMVAYSSKDLLRWREARSLAFVRWGYESQPPGKGEQVHMGASVWSRGNVVIGLYGQMHGDPTAGQSWLGLGSRCDLGLVISNDGIHFREPIPDAIFIQRGFDSSTNWDMNFLYQANAYINRGDLTYLYYSGIGEAFGWVTGGDIGLATIPRDQFAYLTIKGDQPSLPRTHGHLLTCPISLNGGRARLFVNADGLSNDASLNVEVLDQNDRPLPGYSGDASVPVRHSGLRQSVTWRQGNILSDPGGIITLRINLRGDPPRHRPKLYALYVEMID